MNIHDLREAQVRYEHRKEEILKSREKLYHLRSSFTQHFNHNRIRDMSIDEYASGAELPSKGYNFCYALERQLDGLGLGADHARISHMVKSVCISSGFDRLINFLQLLDALSKVKEYELLSTPYYAKNIRKMETDRLNQVIDFMMENYQHDITLDRLASIIEMNKASFCRYFKTRVHKTCTQFLNEIRITQACKLLSNNRLTISEIGYEVGYNNISHFNRQFKLFIGVSAKVYRKRVLTIQ